MYRVTKTYGHNLGLSACFRQPRAVSHCRFLHGYALAFELVFEAKTLDVNNWVIDFGSLKPVKQMLVDTFDHKLLVSADDRLLRGLCDELDANAVADVIVLPAVGCEAFAKHVFDKASQLTITPWDRAERGLRLVSVECREHGANSATYYGDEI